MVGRDAHFGHDFADAFANRLDVILLDVLRAYVCVLVSAQLLERFERDIGVHCLRAIASEHAIMMHFARFACLNDEPRLHAQTLAHQMMMHGRCCEKRRHSNAVFVLSAVGKDQDVLVLQDRLGRSPAHFLERHFQAIGACLGIPSHVNRRRAECAVQRCFDRADFCQILIGEDRLLHFQTFVRARRMAQQIGARANHRKQAHHQLFADRINRRIGHLGKVLLEIVIKQARFARKHGNRCVCAHRADWIIALDRHRFQEFADVFLRIAERLLRLQERGRFLIFVLRKLGKFRVDNG